MARITRLTERDLTRIVKRTIMEMEENSNEDFTFDIKAVDCDSSEEYMDEEDNKGHVDIEEDEDGNKVIIIRYCRGDEESLRDLKRKGKGLIYADYGMNPNDAMKMVDDNQTSKYTSYGKPSKYDPQYSQDPRERYDHGGSQSGH
jgi:hypothetical protein